LIFIFPLFFVSVPCARLSWPSRQLLSARKSTVSYRIVSYRDSGHVNLGALHSFDSVGRYRVCHGHFFDVLPANHAAYDHLPPASDDLVLGGIDERVQATVAVGARTSQTLDTANPSWVPRQNA